MLVINADNVNHAYHLGRMHLNEQGILMDSRNGRVLKFDGPVVTAYKYPQERVLFDAKRDANPYFHLFEAIWMLGGRNDVKFLEQYNSTIGQFSDDGEILHGAYGWRWRKHYGIDQIDHAIWELASNPLSRRVVISMWDPYIDTAVAEEGGKDVPCNTQIYFNIRPNNELDMTVTNRSNDMIWGAYGANAVHMSILHEYVALSVGVPMGTYYQFSNDLHVYERHFELVRDMEDLPRYIEWYEDESQFRPLFDKPGGQGKGAFDLDIKTFLEDPRALQNNYRTDWFAKTVSPMARSHAMYKAGMFESATQLAEQIESEDWRKAVVSWLARRIPKKV